MRNFNEIIRKDVPYDNINSHKKLGFHPLLPQWGVKLTPLPSHFRVKGSRFLKAKTTENEKKYITCKSLFKNLNGKSSKFYYSRKLDSSKRGTWDKIKVIRKTKTCKNEIDRIKTFDQETNC